jgi:hypothetical protein
MTIPDQPDTPEGALDEPGVGGLEEAFRLADRLAVHGADCVCPPCASRLSGLLSELARALGGS